MAGPPDGGNFVPGLPVAGEQAAVTRQRFVPKLAAAGERAAVTRRDFVAGLAATAPISLTACPKQKVPPTVSFVGQAPERGHIIRDRAQSIHRVAETIRTKILIVGGGAAGAAACWRLARAGFRDYLLAELEPVLGGTARSGSTERSAYPMGAHYLPSPHPSFKELHTLLEDLDVIVSRDRDGTPDFDPRVVCRAPVERHRYRGKWDEGIYPAAGQTPDEEAQWARWQAHLRTFDDKTGKDGRRLFDLPLDRSSTDLRHLDRISAAQYLDQLGFDSWRLRWTVDYSCRDDYGCRLEETSAFAMLHHFLARGLEDEHDRVLLSWPEGNARLVDEMIARADLGDRRRPDHAVLRIDPDSGRAHAYDIANDRTIAIDADVILWAAPRFVLAHVLHADPLPRGALSYTPWLVANVELDRRPAGIGAPLSWDNVAIDADHLGYVVATHTENLVQTTHSGTVITFYEPLTAPDPTTLTKRRTDLLTGTSAHWAAHVTAALDGMHPGITPSIRRLDIARWGHAMVRPIPGLLFGETLKRAATPIGKVLPCAADVGGLPLFEQAFTLGLRAAEEALQRLS